MYGNVKVQASLQDSMVENAVMKIMEEERSINEEIDRLMETKRQIREVSERLREVFLCRIRVLCVFRVRLREVLCQYKLPDSQCLLAYFVQ